MMLGKVGYFRVAGRRGWGNLQRELDEVGKNLIHLANNSCSFLSPAINEQLQLSSPRPPVPTGSRFPRRQLVTPTEYGLKDGVGG